MSRLGIAEIEKTLRDLLGCPVSVVPGGMPGGKEGVTGAYVDGDGTLRAALWVDRRLAAYLGASLAMVPKAEADEACTGALPENLMENLSEVLNVLARVLGQGGRARLAGVAQTPPQPDVVAPVVAGSARTWLKIDVSGYGAGVAVVLRAAA